jgi:hypothetical protein
MDYCSTIAGPATALLAFLILAGAGCATSNQSVEQAQLAAKRADAAAYRAEASAAAAEKAAHDATLAADRVEKTVREDSKAIDADIARINYLLAQQERPRHHRRKSRRRHHAPAVNATYPNPEPGSESIAPAKEGGHL